MAKVQILFNQGGKGNLPYFINENNIYSIGNEFIVLADKFYYNDKFNQLEKDKSNSVIYHIKSGAEIFDFGYFGEKIDKLSLKNDTQNYILGLLKKWKYSGINIDVFFNAINKAEVINDITEIENRYFSKLEKKKPIVQQLGKYKISDNSLLSYNTELIHNSDNKAIVSEFKKWVKFVNEVALFNGYNANLELLDNNEYLCTINHDKGAYKFKIYLTDTMHHDFKQCLGISNFKHEISEQNNELIQSINNNIKPKNTAKNSVIIVSDSVYNAMLSNLLINISILNPIALIESSINFEPPTERPIKTDKDYITIEYPIGYIPPFPKKITKIDNKDIINYEPIKSNATKLIVTAKGVLVEIPKNFKIMNKEQNKDKYKHDGYIEYFNERYKKLDLLYTRWRNIKNEKQFNKVVESFNKQRFDSVYYSNFTGFCLYLLDRNELVIKDNKVMIKDFISFIKQCHSIKLESII